MLMFLEYRDQQIDHKDRDDDFRKSIFAIGNTKFAAIPAVSSVQVLELDQRNVASHLGSLRKRCHLQRC